MTRFLGLRCRACGGERTAAPYCGRCAGPAEAEAVYDLSGLSDVPDAGTRGIWRYAALLPVRDSGARTTLGEGRTPLLGPYPGPDGRRLWIKNESANPTWSYKDRLAAVGVSAAREAGARTVAVSSTGNHGAAVAAYAAAAGLAAVVITRPETGANTVHLLTAFGATVLAAAPHRRWALLAQGVEEHGWYPLSGSGVPYVGNPLALEGYKTLAFEIVEQLGRVPAAVVLPTCYGEGIAGTWAGFEVIAELTGVDRPVMIAAEPAGGAPLHRALSSGSATVSAVPAYATVAGSIAGTTSSTRALQALTASGGTAVPVTDTEVLAAQRWLGTHTGLFGEPAGVAGFAALPASRAVRPDLGPDVVVVLTAGGLRTADGPSTIPLADELDDDVFRTPHGIHRTAVAW